MRNFFEDPPDSADSDIQWDTAHLLRIWTFPDPEYEDIQEWEIEHPQSCPRAVTIRYPSCLMSVEFECQVQYEIDNAGLESLDPNPLELDEGEYLITAWCEMWPGSYDSPPDANGGMTVHGFLENGIWKNGKHKLVFAREQLANWVKCEERALQTTSRASQELQKRGADQNLLGVPRDRPEL